MALLIAYPFIAAYRGVAVSLLWGWFVVPLFAVQPLGIVDAIGLSLLTGLLTYQGSGKDERSAGLIVASAVVGTTLVIAFGFIWQLFR